MPEGFDDDCHTEARLGQHVIRDGIRDGQPIRFCVFCGRLEDGVWFDAPARRPVIVSSFYRICEYVVIPKKHVRIYVGCGGAGCVSANHPARYSKDAVPEEWDVDGKGDTFVCQQCHGSGIVKIGAALTTLARH